MVARGDGVNEHTRMALELERWALLARASANHHYEEFKRLADKDDGEARNCERAYDVESIQADVLSAVARYIRKQSVIFALWEFRRQVFRRNYAPARDVIALVALQVSKGCTDDEIVSSLDDIFDGAKLRGMCVATRAANCDIEAVKRAISREVWIPGE